MSLLVFLLVLIAMCAVLFLVGLGVHAAARAVATFGTSVGSSVATLAEGGGEKAMTAMDQALGVAEVGALALLATGEVTDRERAALRAGRGKDHVIGLEEVLERARVALPDRSDVAAVRAAIVKAGADLDAEHRRAARDLVASLAQAGAQMSTAGDDYRGRRRAEPGTLVGLVADALDLPAPGKKLARGE